MEKTSIAIIGGCGLEKLFEARAQERPTARELSKVTKQTIPKVEKLLIETIKGLPMTRKQTCPCASALQSARFR